MSKIHFFTIQKSYHLSILVILFLVSSFLLLCSFTSVAFAQANSQINYQGKLTDENGVTVPNGSYNITFNLYSTSTHGSSLWTEVRTGGNAVTVTNGLFSVMLGSVTPLTGVDFNQTLYLGVTIGSDDEMTPRKVLGTVPAAFIANRALDANTVGGVASSSLVRTNTTGQVEATSSNTLFSFIQNGTGAIARFFSGITEVFTILNNGNVGVGTSTPDRLFTVAGSARITGDTTLATTTLASTTVTRLTLGGGSLTSFTGTGLTITNGALTVATSSLTGLDATTFNGQLPSFYLARANQTGTQPTSTITGVFADSSIADDITLTNLTQITNRSILDTTGTLTVARGGTGTTTFPIGSLLVGNGTSALTSTTTAGLKATLGLNNVENTALSTWAGSTNLTTVGTLTSLTVSGNTTLATTTLASTTVTRLTLGGGSLTSFTGTGLTITNGALTVATSSLTGLDATTFNGQLPSFYLARANQTGTQPTSTITGVFADSSIADDITLTNLTQITNRSILDTTGTLTVARGGTGTTTFPIGSLLVGNGTSALTSTTTAGLKATLGLNNVENTALSTWAGSTNLTTVGTLTSLTVSGNTTLATTTLASTTVTRLTLGGGSLTSFTGTGLTITNGALTVATSSLTGLDATTFNGQLPSFYLARANQTGTQPTSTITGVFADSSIADDITLTNLTQITNRSILDTTGTLTVARGGTGTTTFPIGSLLVGNGTSALTSTTTAGLKATLGLNNVENTALSTWAGSTNLTTVGTLTSLTVSGNTTLATTTLASTTVTRLTLGGGSLTSFTGTGLTITNGALTVATSSLTGLDATTFNGQLPSFYLARANQTGTQPTSTITGVFADSSIADDITLTNLTQITNRSILDTTGTLTVARGGTGTTTFPIGSLLVGNGTSALTSTTTAGLKATLGLNNVENTALSTWAGSTNLTTVGTLTSLTVSGNTTLATTTLASTTVTRLTLGGGSLTSFTGTGLTITNGALTVATSSLTGLDATTFNGQLPSFYLARANQTGTQPTSTITGVFADSSIADDITLTNLTQITNRSILDTTGTLTVARGGTGTTTFPIGSLLVGNGTSALTSTTTAGLKATLGLNNVENTALSTWAGSTNLTTVGTLTSLTVSGNTTLATTTLASTTVTRLTLGGGSLTSFTGTGLTITNGALTVATSSLTGLDATTFNGQLPSFYLARANQTGTQPTSTITGVFADSSIADDITLTNLTQITNRSILDTTGTLTVARGGTGTTTFPIGSLLVGNGTSALTSTTTAGLKATLGLNNVENTALSTWAGSTNLTTVGTLTSLTVSGNTTLATTTLASTTVTRLTLGGGSLTSFTGTGLTITNGALTVATSSLTGLDATTFNGQLPSFYLARANQTGTQPTSTITGVFADSSIADDITLTNLTQITNRSILDTTGTLTVARGGTGTTTFGGTNTLLYTTAANTLATLATANNGVLITSAGGVPSIATTLPATVQGNITQLGTLTTLTTTNASSTNLTVSGNSYLGTIRTGSIASTFGNIDIGSSIFTGNGSGLTTLNASNLSSGTVPDARIAGSYTGITGTGALNAGSITSGFGNINIGTSSFTNTGTAAFGTTTITGNLVVGTQTNKATISYLTNTARTLTIPNVGGDRTFAFLEQAQTFSGAQTFSSTVTFSDLTANRLLTTTTGGVATTTITLANVIASISDVSGSTGTGNLVLSTSPTFTTQITTPSVTNAGTLALSATGANIITASTNGTERLRITSGGNVGIGTTTPGSLLTVAGTTRLTGTVALNSLTANRLVTTNGSSELATTITLANLIASVSDVSGSTGTGNLVLSASPTFTGTPQVRTSGSTGYVNLASGTESPDRPGYIGFHTSDGTRRGYFGWKNGSTNDLLLVGENGWGIRIVATTTFDGKLVLGSNYISNDGGENEGLTFDTTGGAVLRAVAFGNNQLGGLFIRTRSPSAGGWSNQDFGIGLRSNSGGVPRLVLRERDVDVLSSVAGNIGLGTSTTSPAHTLDVGGTVRVTDLTANRLVTTNGSSQLVSTITLANLIASVSDVSGSTGTGNLVLSAAPTFTGNTTLANASSTNLTVSGNSYLGTIRTGSIASTFGNIDIGSSIFTGNGSGLTTLNASNLSSGTVPDARIAGSYTGITGTGALNAGSITSGFGNINIGTSSFTNTGTAAFGTTTITGNLVVGTQTNKATISYLTNTARTLTIPNVGGDRTFAFLEQAQTFSGAQTFSSTVTFSDLTANRLLTTTTGGVATTTITLANVIASISDVSGSTGTGNLVLSAAPTFTGNTTLANASTTNFTVSTNSYLGTIRSGSIASTFGNIDIGTSNLTADGSVALGRPSDNWTTGGNFYRVGGSTIQLGQLDHHGSNQVTLTSNGYRNSGGTWTSYGAAGNIGAAQIALDPAGQILFRLESSKASGTAFSITEVARFNTSGNFGIGTTTPGSLLTVAGNGKFTGFIDADVSFRGQANDSESAPSFTWTGDIDTGIFRPLANRIAFATAGVEAMRINDNQRLFIGTTTTSITPVARATIFDATNPQLRLLASESNALSFFQSTSDGVISSTGRLELNSGGSPILIAGQTNVNIGTTTAGSASLQTRLTLKNNNATDGSTAVGISFAASSGVHEKGLIAFLRTNSSGRGSLIFATNNANDTTPATLSDERMRITADGLVGIGTSTPTARLHVTGLSGSSDIFAISSSSNARLLTFTANGRLGIGTSTPTRALQVIGDIRVGQSGTNGCVERFDGTALTGTCSSDSLLKTNILPLSSDSSSYSFIDRFADITLVSYQWNETARSVYSRNTGTRVVGLLAEEVEAVFPELVSRDSFGYRQVDFTSLTFYVMQAVREIWLAVRGNQEKIEVLESRIQQLEMQLQSQNIQNSTVVSTNNEVTTTTTEQVDEEIEIINEPEIVFGGDTESE